ncbi:MAG: hypothetical protein QE277_11095 [Flectobacillus sp.]|nr:hypothetical protein [Flectobacillus sp.]
MRTTLTFLILGILLLNSTTLSAQDDKTKQLPQSITGFGKLQLGMSINAIPELNDANKSTSSEEFFKKVYHNKSRAVYEVICDTNETYPQGEYDPRVREFQIGKYDLTDKITVTDIKLKFFNGLLYFIQISDSQMSELMKTKYGDGEMDVKKKDHTFQNGYGATFVKTDQTYTTKWLVDKPNITCEYTLMSWYNRHGEQSVVAFTLLSDETHNKEIEIETQKIKDRIKERANSKKKADLKGF